jgi:single-stranded-DNA-specific exonuclease
VAALAQALGVRPLVAELLLRRGIAEPEQARRFLDPTLDQLHDPFLLKGMAQAAERLATALAQGQRIAISGDYDVDGITSSALLGHFLKAAGGDAQVFIPSRFDHGYGLTPASVEALMQIRPRLVVTVDNGITARAEVERLHAAAIETIVTDHHLPLAEGVPAGIVVNPLQPGCPYPFKRISGCGVTFKLVTALRKLLRERGWWSPARPEPNLKEYLDLVAIGTVADIVPLVDENRVFVHHGLEVLNRRDPLHPRRPGIAALAAVARAESITARTIGFQLAPRLNAAGRMTDGGLGVELLLATEPERAQALALQLDGENSARRQTGDEMFREAVRLIEAGGLAARGALLVASPAFHEGVIGIVASRLVERYHLPALVLAENGRSYRGSARSLPGLNVTQAIAAGADLLEQFGGHPAAGGCKLAKERLPAFRERFLAACEAEARRAGPPALQLDARLDPATLDPGLVEQLLRLEPYGHGNPEPAFVLEHTALPAAPPKVLKERHLKWTLGRGLDLFAPGLAEGYAPSPDLLYQVTLGFNEFRGNRRMQLTVQGTATRDALVEGAER